MTQVENKNKKTSVSQAIPTNFSPKLDTRFILDFDEIDAFLVKKIELPPFVPGKFGELVPKNNVRLHLHSAVAPNTEQQVQNVVAKQHQGTKTDAVLKYVDRVGNITNEWVFKNSKITSVKFTPLDYANKSDTLECIVNFRFDQIKFG